MAFASRSHAGSAPGPGVPAARSLLAGAARSLAVAGVVGACADPLDANLPSSDGALLCDQPIEAITIVPGDSEIEAGDGRSVIELQYAAVATFADGRRAVVPAGWGLDIPWAGNITEQGIFTASGAGGGQGHVVARVGDQTASVRLAVKLLRSHFIGTSGDTSELFDEGRRRDFTTAPPHFLEPADGDLLPSSPSDVALRWNGAGHDVFRLIFESGTTAVSIYTSEERYAPEPDVWQALARSNTGRTVRISLEAADVGGDRVHRTAAPITVGLCRTDEPCNGVDDDCDAQIDNSCTPLPEPNTPEERCP